MAWWEANGLTYIPGLSGNAVLDRLVEAAADDLRVRRAETQAPVFWPRRTVPAASTLRQRKTAIPVGIKRLGHNTSALSG
jgi:hypothetical protein